MESDNGTGFDFTSGDAETLSEFVSLLTRHQPDLWAFVLSRLPGHPEVEDILQETNVALWVNRERFEPGTDFVAWAFTVAKFVILRHLKKNKRGNWLVFSDQLLELMDTESPAEFRDGGSRLRLLEACLGKLRPEDRDLLDYRYDRRGDLESLGRSLGRSASSLSVTLHRIRAALRTCIEREQNREEQMA